MTTSRSIMHHTGFDGQVFETVEAVLERLLNASPVGMVQDYAGLTEPSRWVFCYGQAISRTTYAALFAVLSTTYGVGDGSTTFNVPDCRGRVVAGQDDMGGSSANRLTSPASTVGGIDGDVLGGTGGAETHVITTAQQATHSHTAGTLAADNALIELTYNDNGAQSGGNFNALSRGNLAFGSALGTDISNAHGHTISGSTASAGSDAAHNNVQPTIILNKIIYTGVA
jgi:microcystin-dependent protein